MNYSFRIATTLAGAAEPPFIFNGKAATLKPVVRIIRLMRNSWSIAEVGVYRCYIVLVPAKWVSMSSRWLTPGYVSEVLKACG